MYMPVYMHKHKYMYIGTVYIIGRTAYVVTKIDFLFLLDILIFISQPSFREVWPYV